MEHTHEECLVAMDAQTRMIVSHCSEKYTSGNAWEAAPFYSGQYYQLAT
jgi:hypothetical protein